MRTPQRILAALALAGVALSAAPTFAQFDFGGGGFDETPPWEQFPLNAKARVKMDFRNASIDAVLRMLSKASGVTIVKDPALTGGVTLQSPAQQSLPDAFAMLNAVLQLKNYNLVKEGNFLVVRQRQQGFGGRFGGGRGQGGGGGFGGGGFGGGGGGGDQSQLRVYAIKYANAAQVARVINDVFALPPTQPQAAQQPGAAGQAPAAPQAGGGGGGNGRPGGGGGGAAGGGGFGGGGRFGGRRGGFGLSVSGSAVKASSDDFSNSVIVNAPGRDHEQIGRLIEQIDKQTEEPQKSRVFPLTYASAADLAPVVQNVLVSNAPRGRGGIGTQNVPIDQRFQQAARFGSAQAAFGTVVADARTNSLVVTATDDNLTVIGRVLEELDKPVTFENSTFVVTLKNARADAVAQLLNQSFGARTGGFGGGFGGNTFGRTGTANRTNFQQRTNGGPPRTNNPSGLGGRSEAPPPGGGAAGDNAAEGDGVASAGSNAIPLDLADPGAESGDLATRVSVKDGIQVAMAAAQGGGGQGRRGGFGLGGGGGQGRGGAAAQAGGASGLNGEGQVVNVRDLTGQVSAVPDVNTNSVIVVTSPENRAIIEQILDQLDRIPEQVVIETLIVEASLDASKKLGVEWNLTQQGDAFGIKNARGSGTSSFGLLGDTAQPQGLRYTLTGTQYSAFLQAVQSDSRFDVLSTPRIFTSNNATAEINISQSLPYVLNQRFDNNGTPIFNYSFLDVGIVLTVTPRITSNGYVTMDVTQTANDFVRYTEFNAPVVNRREAETTVSVRDGETVVLGGVIRNSVQATVNKVPLLGDIPLLGKLFRSRTEAKNKTELLVFLTPRIVRDVDEARRLREETERTLDPRTKKRIDEVRPLLLAPTPPSPPAQAPPATGPKK